MDSLFQPAAEQDVAPICALIRSRIAWMDEQGLESWNKTNYLERYREAYFYEKCRAGELYVLRSAGGALLGSAVLLTEDERWASQPPVRAYYIHNLVSAPDAHGAGSAIIRCVERFARQGGMQAVRLDCIRSNEAINRFYERAGYLACGACTDGPYHGILREKRL